MPIEIKITDVSKLTVTEMQNLTNYLSASCFNKGNKIPTMFVPDASGNAVEVKIDNVNYFDSEIPVKKTRKKRKARIGTPEAIFSAGDIITLNTADDTVGITYDELVSYVLENTREKKILYGQVMDTLKKFGVISLNELENNPTLIEPVYLALKEMVND